MEGNVGAQGVEANVRRLANETSRLHQQLLSLLAQGFSKTPSVETQGAQNEALPRASRNVEGGPHCEPGPSGSQKVTQGAEEAATDDAGIRPEKLVQSTTGAPEPLESPAKVVAKLLHQQDELIAAYALTKGQKTSRDYKMTREELLMERRNVLKKVAMKLHRAEEAMEDVLDSCSMYKRSKTGNDLLEEGAKDSQRQVTVGDIVSYAHKISYSSFAPPIFIMNQELPPGFQPPAPQAEHMRGSALYQFTDEELGFRPVPSATSLEPKAPEPAPSAAEALPKPPPGWKPGMPVELPPMPPGWKPGMELPPPPLALKNLPSMPPGWKPGDPIPLPVVQPQVPPPEGLRPRAQPIQVAHVDLDLNPDLEGGFYSSDSEDEDDESDSEDE